MENLCNAFTSNLIISGDDSKDIHHILSENFIKCVKGYHIINDDAIKETPWEDINAQILDASGFSISSLSNGSHKSGADISCSLGNLSNKSSQYHDEQMTSFKISSYRLTCVCSDKEPGKIENILAEIDNRKDFKYYSIIVRKDNKHEILYDWFLIPSDYTQLNPSSYHWKPKVGKQGKNKDSITGWQSNIIHGSFMSITFSMSSQLWIHLVITEDMYEFKIASCKIKKGRKINYIQLYDSNFV
jgi:hypothetical protein